MDLKTFFLIISTLISSSSCNADQNINITTEQIVPITTTAQSNIVTTEKVYPPVKNSTTKILRNPKFGFNLPGNIQIPGLTDITTTPYPNYANDISNQQGNLGSDPTRLVDPGGVGIASTIALVKGGVLGGLTALKAAVLPPLFIGAVIVFLVAGAAFFACNVVNCRGFLGNFGGLGSTFGGGGSSPFSSLLSRNEFDSSPSYYGGSPSSSLDPYNYYENQVQPVYQALDEGYKKYDGSKKSIDKQ